MHLKGPCSLSVHYIPGDCIDTGLDYFSASISKHDVNKVKYTTNTMKLDMKLT